MLNFIQITKTIQSTIPGKRQMGMRGLHTRPSIYLVTNAYSERQTGGGGGNISESKVISRIKPARMYLHINVGNGYNIRNKY